MHLSGERVLNSANPFAGNFEWVSNLPCAQANSASYPR